MRRQWTMGSLFAGIGAMELAFERNGFRCEWSSEIEPNCSSILRRQFPGARNHGDITKIKELPHVDVVTAGAPCQDVSVCGKGRGLNEETGEITRTGLFFPAADLVGGSVRPKFLLLENVPGLLSNKGGESFRKIIETLQARDYSSTWFVLSAEHFGVPQSRRRVFVIASDDRVPNLGAALLLRLKALGESVFRDSETSKEQEDPGASEGGAPAWCVYAPAIAGTIRSGGSGGVPSSRGENIVAVHQNGSGELRESDTAYTVSTNGNASGRNAPLLRDGTIVRKFSVTEVERLFGLPDDWTKWGKDEDGKPRVISDNARRKCLGNAVVVNVVEWIAGQVIRPCLEFVCDNQGVL